MKTQDSKTWELGKAVLKGEMYAINVYIAKKCKISNQ